MDSSLTILTPVYINTPERLKYLEITLTSFYKSLSYPGTFVHYLVDDRSPILTTELQTLCDSFGVHIIRRINEQERRSFFDTFETLLRAVKTEYFCYLEPDHYFYLQYDFVTPIFKMYGMSAELKQVYLRAPLYYKQFEVISPQQIRTWDGTLLDRLVIDASNTAWLGRGTVHETFSLMPSIFATERVRDDLLEKFIDGGPAELESAIALKWQNTALVAYLNAQAFCYHIGAVGKHGPGGYLSVGDQKYESVWSNKII